MVDESTDCLRSVCVCGEASLPAARWCGNCGAELPTVAPHDRVKFYGSAANKTGRVFAQWQGRIRFTPNYDPVSLSCAAVACSWDPAEIPHSTVWTELSSTPCEVTDVASTEVALYELGLPATQRGRAVAVDYVLCRHVVTAHGTSGFTLTDKHYFSLGDERGYATPRLATDAAGFVTDAYVVRRVLTQSDVLGYACHVLERYPPVRAEPRRRPWELTVFAEDGTIRCVLAFENEVDAEAAAAHECGVPWGEPMSWSTRLLFGRWASVNYVGPGASGDRNSDATDEYVPPSEKLWNPNDSIGG